MINPVKYLLIPIDVKSFNRIIRFIKKSEGRNSDLEVSNDYFQKICEPNEFVRLKYEEFYIDIKLLKFRKNDKCITLSFGNIIDYNRTKFLTKGEINKRNIAKLLK